MQVIEALQLRYTSAEQVLAAAAVFLILCDRFGVPPTDAFNAVNNVMLHRVAGVAGMRPEFVAVQLYAQNEII